MRINCSWTQLLSSWRWSKMAACNCCTVPDSDNSLTSRDLAPPRPTLNSASAYTDHLGSSILIFTSHNFKEMSWLILFKKTMRQYYQYAFKHNFFTWKWDTCPLLYLLKCSFKIANRNVRQLSMSKLEKASAHFSQKHLLCTVDLACEPTRHI